jgi:pSer/pThr/pTyr-binding forkhead associated (FHA) protein
LRRLAPDSTVSQVHARLFRQGGKLWVEDLGSTNGTWVNKVKVSSPVALRRGDRVLVGGTMLEVSR